MRLRRKPWIDTAIHDFDDFVYPKDRPATEAERGRWKEIFGRPAPLYVELGTGKGGFISQIAAPASSARLRRGSRKTASSASRHSRTSFTKRRSASARRTSPTCGFSSSTSTP